MPATGWERRWRGGRRAEDRALARIQRGVNEEPLAALLHLGARALLAAAGADRAGLWLSASRRSESGTGCVVEAKPGPIPEQWNLLDVSAPFLRVALQSPNPLRVDLVAEEATSHLGPLIGMQSAVWIPLRSGDRALGLGMAGYARPPGKLDLNAMLALADEIVLAVQNSWNPAGRKQSARPVQREVEERLEAEMAGLLASIDSGVLLFDAEGRILMASDRLAAIFGIESRRMRECGTIEALIDSLAYQFALPAETASRWREHLRLQDEASWDELELVRPSRKIVERFARPLYKPNGARLGWLEVYRDITGQRLIQSKLLQTEKMAALGQLVSGIAHELNNPLTSIQGYAQLLLSRHSSSERAADAQRISQEAERAGRIVKNLLLFSREAKSERRPVHLNEIIERTLSLRSYELKLEDIEVELVLDPGLPQTLADAAQLQQVVLNLIVNAEQAIVMARGEESPTGHILIRTRRLPGDRLALEVTDDGPGIPHEIASRIFDPFFTTKPAGVGTGLGLSIVYGIVQEHGGEVSVESLRGHGAVLTIELPALAASGFDLASEKPAIQPRVAESARVLGASTNRKHILIVEDEPTVADLIADVLSEEGHRVDTLLDSRAALGRLEEKKYSLVVCDLKMPYVDGPGLYRALVRRTNPMQHKFLFVTGDTMGPRTLEFLKASGLPYLAKPFLVEELKDAVRQALEAVQASEGIALGPRRSRVAGKES